jgi:hypothetical protein
MVNRSSESVSSIRHTLQIMPRWHDSAMYPMAKHPRAVCSAAVHRLTFSGVGSAIYLSMGGQAGWHRDSMTAQIWEDCTPVRKETRGTKYRGRPGTKFNWVRQHEKYIWTKQGQIPWPSWKSLAKSILINLNGAFWPGCVHPAITP